MWLCMTTRQQMMMRSVLWKVTWSAMLQWLTMGGWRDEWKEQESMECCLQITLSQSDEEMQLYFAFEPDC